MTARNMCEETQLANKLIMTGEGADELLGGYHWFDGDRRARKFLRWPQFLRSTLAHAPINIST
ncbi:MAG TPA: asparagine synthase-related protein, partial [Anaerolineae bacterium]|nr:asparagine synthase-related protein [Anaerolineae bacterium]